MAKQVRKPPSPSDANDPRAREYFDLDLFDQHRLVGTKTVDLASIPAGAQSSITITVNGALADTRQTVEYGLPSNWNTGLSISSAYVSAADTVTLIVRNHTGGAIDMPSATYSARVRP